MNLLEGKSRYLYLFLIFSIFIGVFARFWGLGETYLEGDEAAWMVSEIKLNHASSSYDPRFYLYEHPPVARWFIGFPTRFVDADYDQTMAIPPEMYVYAYYAPFKEVIVPMRLVSAFFGGLSVILIFLITKKIYGIKAGIWSAAVASLSHDLIFYSRWTLSESVFVGLALATIYAYIKYLEEKEVSKKLSLMAITAFFFTLTLGTRAFSPMILIPTLIISQFLINKGKSHIKENTLFLLLLGISWYVFFYIIWPPEVRNLAQQLHSVFSLSDVLRFSIPDVIAANIFRNSYLYLFSLVLLAYYAANKFGLLSKNAEGGSKGAGFNPAEIMAYIKSSNTSLVFVILLIMSIFAFGFTKYFNFRYQILLFLPLFILAGKPLERASENKRVQIALVFLILINFYFLARVYPYYSEYQNFSFDKCGKNVILCTTTSSYNHISEIKQAIEYLKSKNSPPTITTEFNVLAFYGGESIPLIAAYDQKCNQKDIEELTKKYQYIVYFGARGGSPDLRTDQYMCPYLRARPMELVKSLGNYAPVSPLENPEAIKVKIYKINQTA